METKVHYIKIGPPLGEGSFGEVYKVLKKMPDGTLKGPIALKIVDVNSYLANKYIDSIKQEIETLKDLSTPTCHPHIVCYYDGYFDETSGKFIIEMEYIEGETLDSLARAKFSNLPKDIAYKYALYLAVELTKALKFIHSKNIIHNDLHMNNVMIDNNLEPKIIDFGISCTLKSNEDHCVVANVEASTKYDMRNLAITLSTIVMIIDDIPWQLLELTSDIFLTYGKPFPGSVFPSDNGIEKQYFSKPNLPNIRGYEDRDILIEIINELFDGIYRSRIVEKPDNIVEIMKNTPEKYSTGINSIIVNYYLNIMDMDVPGLIMKYPKS